ncbi:nudC domain-containing protein 3-like [Ctenocephalides felis]|uniref:nudC domain-containing protein 3-like n=1 Tax=Ctenocephalides felis TaxID=7515 RepID=UPI000E6E3DFA|nr:nudC domain-containing protein 3-like [Ctenocephalides felis]
MTCSTDSLFIEIFQKGDDINTFFDALFGFLNRCTNFYEEDINVCEQVCMQYLRLWHPENICITNNHEAHLNNIETIDSDSKNHIEEVMSTDEQICLNKNEIYNTNLHQSDIVYDNEIEISSCDDIEPVMSADIKFKHNTSSESYNGAVTEKYTWSQSINEIDIYITLPETITSSSQLKVLITPAHLKVEFKDESTPYIDEDFPFNCKPSESVWWLSNGRLLIHLQKKEDRWWQKLLESDTSLDISKMNCSRPLDELSEDAQTLVQEMFWNEAQKSMGKPTTEDIRNRELLRKSWNADGSPFQGTEFDPSLVNFQ